MLRSGKKVSGHGDPCLPCHLYNRCHQQGDSIFSSASWCLSQHSLTIWPSPGAGKLGGLPLGSLARCAWDWEGAPVSVASRTASVG